MNYDERLGFYLENRNQIDEWVGLRAEALETSHEFFKSLEGPIRAETLACRPRPRVAGVASGRAYNGIILTQEHWPAYTGRYGMLISVTLEWHRKRTLFDGSWFGIRCDRRGDADGLRERLMVAMKEHKMPKELRSKVGESPYFPAIWRMRPRREQYWTDLDGFSKELVDTVAVLWPHLAKITESALKMS